MKLLKLYKITDFLNECFYGQNTMSKEKINLKDTNLLFGFY